MLRALRTVPRVSRIVYRRGIRSFSELPKETPKEVPKDVNPKEPGGVKYEKGWDLWFQRKDEQGNFYYWNAMTEKIQHTQPEYYTPFGNGIEIA